MAIENARKENPIASFGGKTIDLVKFNVESEERQYEIIEEALNEIYEDNLKVTKKHVMKVIRLTLNPKDDYTYLPYNLKVNKQKLELIFEVNNKRVGILPIILALVLLLFALIGATYAGIRYLSLADLNKDIDGDGIADINIDINNDNRAEINVDTNGDDRPDLNIDYKGNRRSVFNIDTDGDGTKDSNLVNDATDGKVCAINCDIDGDGWPDRNLDLDGDGVVDSDVDTDGDGVVDLNIDINGDGVCDIMCDNDHDGLCDENCISASIPGKENGSSTASGDPNIEAATPILLINFVDGITVNVTKLFPDDQPYIGDDQKVKPYKTFTVENMSDYPVNYSLRWEITYNTFITSNFKYQVEATNGGKTLGYTTVPKTDDYIVRDVTIPARTTQKYTITFNLVGTNTPQNEDQGKVFQGTIKIEI